MSPMMSTTVGSAAPAPEAAASASAREATSLAWRRCSWATRWLAAIAWPAPTSSCRASYSAACRWAAPAAAAASPCCSAPPICRTVPVAIRNGSQKPISKHPLHPIQPRLILRLGNRLDTILQHVLHFVIVRSHDPGLAHHPIVAQLRVAEHLLDDDRRRFRNDRMERNDAAHPVFGCAKVLHVSLPCRFP